MLKKICLILVLVLCLTIPASGFVGSSTVSNSVYGKPALTDISNHWANKEISDWVSKGLAYGYDNGTFKPNNSITREEAMSIVVRLKKLPTVSTYYLPNFNDEYSVSNWAKDAVNTAVAYGLISGYSDNTVGPVGKITRAETVVLLNRALGDLQIKPAPKPTLKPIPWPIPQTGKHEITIEDNKEAYAIYKN
ncbi:S-layer homology domain-containing protein [Aceticella autotrophica]|uniref:S-layer homology domain-containing protein n=1 Tax=Aceticella autotrophica TaxID=2755338 RepID=A0A975AX51_9THEO|nr:S-layer homology domain-containing protein [Aceticella autotrophica]QSZ28064.1 S-layer homology domain-containing protein [Aceticella autotrophica]